MGEISLFMAFVDLIPVVLFFISTIRMMHVFYPRMGSGQYAMFSAGAIMLFFGGVMKVLWKVLYALQICDYSLLSEAFFPLQSMAFILMAVGTAGMLLGKNGRRVMYSVAAPIPVVTSHVPFLILTFWGTTILYTCLVRFNWKIGAKKTGRFLIASYLLNMFQVVWAMKFDNSPAMHWVAQLVNLSSQVCLLIAATQMKKTSDETAPRLKKGAA